MNARVGRVELEWGENGVRLLAQTCEVLVVVDVLRFTTAVDVVVARGGSVTPAEGIPASDDELSPAALGKVRVGGRVLIHSPNGAAISALALATGRPVYAACLRNAEAVARALRGRRVGLLPSGERWPDSGLRFAVEDFIGAGAVVAALGFDCSPEAAAAAAAFRSATDIRRVLIECASGRELLARGLDADVELSAAVNASAAVPVLRAGAFVNERVD